MSKLRAGVTGHVIWEPTPPPGLPRGKPWDGSKKQFGFARETWALNCAAVGAIDPGVSVIFQMRLAIPPDGNGETMLTWSLDGASASASINIIGR